MMGLNKELTSKPSGLMPLEGGSLDAALVLGQMRTHGTDQQDNTSALDSKSFFSSVGEESLRGYLVKGTKHVELSRTVSHLTTEALLVHLPKDVPHLQLLQNPAAQPALQQENVALGHKDAIHEAQIL